MHTDPDSTDPARPRLTPSQATRLEMARTALTTARAMDLAAAEPAALIILVERLRGALDDTIHMVRELAE